MDLSSYLPLSQQGRLSCSIGVSYRSHCQAWLSNAPLGGNDSVITREAVPKRIP